MFFAAHNSNRDSTDSHQRFQLIQQHRFMRKSELFFKSLELTGSIMKHARLVLLSSILFLAIGTLFLGCSKEASFNDAADLLRTKAEAGDLTAQYNLGTMYAAGQGVEQDYVEGIKWIRKAAEQGHAGAQFSLGIYFSDGLKIEPDMVKAFAWITLSAANGNKLAPNFRARLKERMSPQQVADAGRLTKEF